MSTRAGAAAGPEDLLEWTGDWLIREGVSQSARNFSVWREAPVFLFLLLLVAAFQVGAAPYLDVTAAELLVVPLVLLVLALPFRSSFRALLGLSPVRPRHVRLIPVVLLVPVLGTYAWRSGSVGWLTPDPWTDFAVLMATFLSAVLLLDEGRWYGPGRHRTRRALVGLVVLLLVGSVMEGAVFPDWNVTLQRLLAGWGDAVLPVPRSAPVLAVLLVVLVLAMRLPAGDVRTVAPHRVGRTARVPAVSLLILVIGLDSTLVGYYAAGPAEAAVLGVVVLALLLAWGRASRRGSGGRDGTGEPAHDEVRPGSGARWTASLAPRPMTVWVVVYLLSYPAWVLFDGIEVVQDAPVGGAVAFLAALAVNLLWLSVTWVLVGSGAAGIAGWAVREALRNRVATAYALAQGLPLLLLFTAFFVLTSEVWQVVVRTPVANLYALVAVLAGLDALLLLVIAERELCKHAVFGEWSAVAAALPTGEDEPARHFADVPTRFSGVALDRLESLSRRERVNFLLVILFYNLSVLAPMTAAIGVVLWVVARLAVPAPVAGEWVYGDGTLAERGQELLDRGLPTDPWVGVSVVLAVFSALYLTVTILSSAEQRRLVLGGVEGAVRERLAVRLVHKALQLPTAGRSATARLPLARAVR